MRATFGWTTSCNGQGADTTPMELAALGEHSAQCMANNGKLVAVQCGAAHALHFINARLVTSVAFGVALGTALLLVL